MNIVKVVFAVIMVFYSAFAVAQSSIAEGVGIEFHEVGITVDSLEELKTIDWDDFFGVFDLDEYNSKITFFIELADLEVKDEKDNEVHFTKLKYEVSGYESERNELRKQLTSITKKILKKYKS